MTVDEAIQDLQEAQIDPAVAGPLIELLYGASFRPATLTLRILVLAALAASVVNPYTLVVYALAIGDTGTGIAEEDREKIFEPYFTTKPSGLGLGLVLTRKIVEAHGGKIVVDSEPEKGTRIHVLLPAEPAG